MSFLGRPLPWQALRKTGLVVTVTGAIFLAGAAAAKGAAPESNGTVSLGQLPAQAQATYRLIHVGGPFASRKDGVVFANRERLLPGQPRGFYREYTVTTPGARNRGARRIVCGGSPPTNPQSCFYTSDHYTSFQRIVQ